MSDKSGVAWALVGAGCIGMFAATATGSTRAPFLPDMAVDLQVSLPAVANLFGITAASWGIASYVAGRYSDKLGREAFLIGSPLCLVLMMCAVAWVPNYATLILLTVLAGFCCGSFTANILAEVSVRTPAAFQGRAMGYVMGGQSLTLLIGVPTAAWLGAYTGWRGMHLVLAGLAVVAALGILMALRTVTPTESHAQPTLSKTARQSALTAPIIRLFCALIAERICFGLAAFYYSAYLRQAYQLPVDALALPLVIFATGNIIGTLVGGQIADRFRYRRISFGVALLVAGVIAIPWFNWRPDLTVTVALGFGFAFFNALARPPLLAAMAEVPVEVRGVVMGMNGAIASIGWLVAALLGGWLYAGTGFGGFGLLIVSMCVVATLIVVPDSKLVQPQTR